MSTTILRHRPYVDPHPTSAIQADAIKRREQMFSDRKRAIKDLIAKAPPSERDEFHWTMTYDLELAPSVTARQRILESAVIPVPPQELLTDPSMHDELWTVIEALAVAGIYLFNTGHLCDSDLYSRLYLKILDEQVRMMPPSCEAAEFIDCLHSLDREHPLGKSLVARDPDLNAPASPGRSPFYPIRGIINQRDSYLPRPSPTHQP